MTGTALIPFDATAASRRPMVFVQDGEVFAESRYVAALFEKRHFHVLRDIDNLIQKDPEHARRAFVESTYEAEQTFGLSESFNNLAGTKTFRRVLMTRDGFTMLAFGFTGEKAVRFKWAYIDAFNAMERELAAERIRAAAPAPLDLRSPKTLAELLTKLIPLTQELQATVEKQAEQIAVAAPKAESFDALMASEGLYVLGEAAKNLDWKPRAFIKELARRGFLFKQQQSWIAKQVWIEAGWFKVRTRQYQHWTSSQTFVTPKGLEGLRRKLTAPSAAKLAFLGNGDLFGGARP